MTGQEAERLFWSQRLQMVEMLTSGLGAVRICGGCDWPTVGMLSRLPGRGSHGEPQPWSDPSRLMGWWWGFTEVIVKSIPLEYRGMKNFNHSKQAV